MTSYEGWERFESTETMEQTVDKRNRRARVLRPIIWVVVLGSIAGVLISVIVRAPSKNE